MLETDVFHKVQRWTPSLDWQRLENSIGSGVFDTVIGHPSGSVWCEFKVRKSAEAVNDLRASQKAWVYLKLKKGLKNFLLFTTDKPTPSLLEVYQLKLDGREVVAQQFFTYSWAAHVKQANPFITDAIRGFIAYVYQTHYE